MSRVDLDTTEADFVEFEFPDEATAELADKAVGFSVHTGATTRHLRIARVDSAREKWEAAGLSWTESESGLTEDEMWPEWPEDSDDEGDDDDDDDVPDEDDVSPRP